MESEDMTIYEVRGTLGMVLRLSRILGVAPLSLTPNGEGYIACVSKTFLVYSWIIFTLVHGVFFTGLYLDLKFFEYGSSYRVETMSALLVWLIDIAMLTTIVALGVWQGTDRMHRTLKLLKRIQKVHNSLNQNCHQHSNEKLMAIGVIGVIIAFNLLMILEFTFYYTSAYHGNMEMFSLIIYNIHYFKHNMVLLILMQISLVVLSIRSAFSLINNGLRKLCDISKFKTVLIPCYPFLISTMEKDQMFNKDRFGAVDFVKAKKYIQELAYYYNFLCNEVETFNNDNGLMMFTILGSFTVYLMISSYYMIKAFCKSGTENGAIIVIILELFFCLYQYLHLFLLIEPCHLTHDEMNKTQILLNKVMYQLTTLGQPILTEIDIFYKQLMLYKPTFSPLNVLTLHLSQIATIFAGVTTYVTIIIQYRVIEECQ